MKKILNNIINRIIIIHLDFISEFVEHLLKKRRMKTTSKTNNMMRIIKSTAPITDIFLKSSFVSSFKT